MIAYDDYDLVNLIIHETVHATIYIKSQADFNERLATFVGDQGATLFFRQREGVDSPTLEHAKLRSADTKAFSLFISKEIENLKSYYEEQKTPIAEEKRQQLFSEIVKRFDSQLKPNLKTDSYLRFGSKPLNNARLLAFQTYLKDLKNFETAFKHLGEDFSRLMKLCKALEAAPDPEKMLADIAKTGIGDSMPF
jgi:predicted aminopeptidase